MGITVVVSSGRWCFDAHWLRLGVMIHIPRQRPRKEDLIDNEIVCEQLCKPSLREGLSQMRQESRFHPISEGNLDIVSDDRMKEDRKHYTCSKSMRKLCHCFYTRNEGTKDLRIPRNHMRCNETIHAQCKKRHREEETEDDAYPLSVDSQK